MRKRLAKKVNFTPNGAHRKSTENAAFDKALKKFLKAARRVTSVTRQPATQVKRRTHANH